jgi:hypothetical protein
MAKQVKYTRISLKKMVDEARIYGVEVSFAMDMDGKYSVYHTSVSTVPGHPELTAKKQDVYRPESCAMAHWFIRGLICSAKSQIDEAVMIKHMQS